MPFVIHPDPDDDPALCSCCAGAPGLRGVVMEDDAPVAMYFAEPAGMPRYPLLRLGLVVGLWTDTALPGDRRALAFSCRPGVDRPECTLVDAYLATFPELVQLGAPLTASAAAQDADAARHHAMALAVIAQDPRLARIGAPGARAHAPLRAR